MRWVKILQPRKDLGSWKLALRMTSTSKQASLVQPTVYIKFITKTISYSQSIIWIIEHLLSHCMKTSDQFQQMQARKTPKEMAMQQVELVEKANAVSEKQLSSKLITNNTLL